MIVCIHKDLLGSPRHLAQSSDRDSFSLCNSVPEDAWVIGSSTPIERSLETIAKAAKFEIDSDPPERYRKMWSSLLANEHKNPPWYLCLPPDVFKKYVEGLLDQLWMLLKSVDNTYYLEQFVIARRVILGLQRAKVDPAVLDRTISAEKHDQIKMSLEKFRPCSDGYARRTTYSQTSSLTGRLTVTDGPNILTLKKDQRSIIQSRYKSGVIAQVDFVSLEPRVMLKIMSVEPPVDIYTSVVENVFTGSISRDIAKTSTILTLYGGSPHTLAKNIPSSSNVDPYEIHKTIRDYFSISSLESKLKRDLKKDGFIRNHYGRRINSGSSLVNHFIQSTSVDVSLMGFGNLINELEIKSVRASPLYIIHDAMLFDIHYDDIEKFKKIIKSGITVPGFSGKFPATFELIND
tara:strand:- start:25854 stop:27068 length:1215 start_codon:yes stop_codon:yes gene_type:complete